MTNFGRAEEVISRVVEYCVFLGDYEAFLDPEAAVWGLFFGRTT
jgi:hypothetical protein